MTKTSAQDAAGFLPEKYLSGMFYGNGWTAGEDTTQAIEPATGKELGQIALANAEDVAEAAKSARRTQREWAALTPDARAEVFLKALSIGQTHFEDIVTWLVRESGSARAKGPSS
ncbi:aldehyde dehydrogenase family protein [Novosphingobium sp. MBES04]|uniref:aldehyde dehydrogenase family protein n=1 Tax=Novosphingobium sp. MBES04 TaxID=1206458 RepID=UPI000AC8B345|nr:aldehyde dehydrogenase family protein [Novosphingobium sp. MBES04]